MEEKSSPLSSAPLRQSGNLWVMLPVVTVAGSCWEAVCLMRFATCKTRERKYPVSFCHRNQARSFLCLLIWWYGTESWGSEKPGGGFQLFMWLLSFATLEMAIDPSGLRFIHLNIIPPSHRKFWETAMTKRMESSNQMKHIGLWPVTVLGHGLDCLHY